MLNNRTITHSKMNPKRISNYNKFLSTLDKTIPIIPIKEDLLDEDKNEEEMKKIIDKIIENLEMDFEKNNLDSTKLTGQTQNDIIVANSEMNDPNEYIEPNSCSTGDTCCQSQAMKKVVKRIYKEKEPVVEIKQHINIEVEINDIADILKLIDTYKADPSIKYNINMKACLLYTSPSPRDRQKSRMPSSA